MVLVDTKKATEFFRAKVEFTTGPAELNEMIRRDENINIVDVRRRGDFEKGHIPGAINLPEEQWDSFHGLRKERLNILCGYSEICHLAASAAWHFSKNDYPVMELEGGFEEWQHYGFPVES